MTPAAVLKNLLDSPELLVAPGCVDALGARLIEQAGFRAVYMTGFGVSASMLGRPDVGLLTATEMVDAARRVVAATSLPVIADGDTGYGNPLNVMRTVEDYERAGVAAIQLEDQVTPKRCGHMDDKQLVATAEMVAKLRAASEARDEMLIIARTDARASEGLDAALERGRAYVDAGADVIFIEALHTAEECAAAAAAGFGVPLLFNRVEGGKTPELSAADAAELGFGIMILPISILLAATRAMQATLAALRSPGTPAADLGTHDAFNEFNAMIGLPEVLALQERFAV